MAKPWEEALPSESWKPEKEEDFIEGLLTEIERNVGVNESTLYKIEVAGGEVKSVWGSTVLDSRMTNVKMGEEVKIIYKGLGKKSPGKNPPKIFQVFHREPEVEITDQEIKEAFPEAVVK